MLEWYRAREDYEAIIADTLALVQLAARMAGTKLFRWRGREADPFAAAEWLTVNDAFKAHAGVDLLSTIRAGRHGGRGGAGRPVARRLRQGRVLVGHLQPHPVGEGGAASRATAASPCSMNIPPSRPHSPAPARA